MQIRSWCEKISDPEQAIKLVRDTQLAVGETLMLGQDTTNSCRSFEITNSEKAVVVPKKKSNDNFVSSKSNYCCFSMTILPWTI